MFRTKNDIPEKTRLESIKLLQHSLCDAINLVYHAKHAHWNVKGPDFIALHELFDKVHEEFDESADLLAERIAQLGGVALGTIQEAVKRSDIPFYPMDAVDGQEHVDALSTSIAAFARCVREGIRSADQAGDADTADIFTQISRMADKNLWFVETHLPVEKRKAKAA